MNPVLSVFAIVLNLPVSLLGLALALLSVPKRIRLIKSPPALVIYVRSFWWYSWIPGQKRVRGVANGHVLQLGPAEQPGDLEHELIHVEQAIRAPFIFSFLILYENLRHGYAHNKYELEAYDKARNLYQRD